MDVAAATERGWKGRPGARLLKPEVVRQVEPLPDAARPAGRTVVAVATQLPAAPAAALPAVRQESQ